MWSHEEMFKAQESDPEIGILIKSFKLGPKPNKQEISLWSADAKRLWYMWPRLEVINGLVYRRWEENDEVKISNQLILPRIFVNEFMKMVHEGMTGGHLGRTKTEH